jgi:hypothetical protein
MADDRYWIDTATEEAVGHLLMDISTGATLSDYAKGTLQGISMNLTSAVEVPDVDARRFPVMIVDEEAGGVIAYATHVDHAARIARALEALGE